jgi:hypothetical protein
VTRVKVLESFEGAPPDVQPGDLVLCRTAGGEWIRKVAMSLPRYDQARSWSRCWLTVATATTENYAAHHGQANWVNWPAEDVRPADEETTRDR